jgi:putative colanic acid biosynthesis glycosyltransferase
MRVLQINSVCGIGSTGRIATDIHKVLVTHGHESYIAYGRGLARNCDSVIKIGNHLDKYIHVAKTRISDMHGFGSKNATNEFIRKVKKINPDVIHLHNIHGYYINVAVLFDYLKKANKPVIWTLHDCWSFTGHCTHFDYVGCDKWKIECHHCPQMLEYPSSLLLDKSRSNYLRKKQVFSGVKNLTIVTPSNWLAELVKESFLNEYPVEVINNGIDVEVFKNKQNDFRQRCNLINKFIILGVANVWTERKGLRYFEKLSEMLENDEVIILVGLSKKQLKRLPRNVIGFSKTESVERLVDIYSSADVYVNPTLEDNFPTTNIEALACGTPVITFDTGGSAESIDESCGFVVEQGNINQLVNRIKRIRKAGKASYSQAAIKRVERHYNKNDRFKQYLERYY